MKVLYYEPTYGLFGTIANMFSKNVIVSPIEAISELEHVESPDFLLLNPEPNFYNGWITAGKYAGDNPETKILVNAIFDNVDEIAERIGYHENVEVLGFREMIDKAHDLIARLK